MVLPRTFASLFLVILTVSEAWVALPPMPIQQQQRSSWLLPTAATRHADRGESTFSTTTSTTLFQSSTTYSESVGTMDTSSLGESSASDVVTRSPSSAETPSIVQTSTTLQIDDDGRRQLLNAILLAVSFGWVAWTVLTIDSGMTRGWTQSEIAMRIPLDTWGGYKESLATQPIYTKTMINVVIYLLGDWLSQTIFQGKNVLDFDASRTLKNGFIGLCFGPLVHLYYEFSDSIIPPDSLIHRCEKIFMDQTIYLSVKASVYVAAVSMLAGQNFEQAQQNVKDRLASIVFTAWKFWPLVHCITYSVIPAQHRILWVNCVDLIWNAILATMSRGKLPSKEVEEVPVTTIEMKLEELEAEPQAVIVRRQELLPDLAGEVPLFAETIETSRSSLSSNNSTVGLLAP